MATLLKLTQIEHYDLFYLLSYEDKVTGKVQRSTRDSHILQWQNPALPFLKKFRNVMSFSPQRHESSPFFLKRYSYGSHASSIGALDVGGGGEGGHHVACRIKEMTLFPVSKLISKT